MLDCVVLAFMKSTVHSVKDRKLFEHCCTYQAKESWCNSTPHPPPPGSPVPHTYKTWFWFSFLLAHCCSGYGFKKKKLSEKTRRFAIVIVLEILSWARLRANHNVEKPYHLFGVRYSALDELMAIASQVMWCDVDEGHVVRKSLQLGSCRVFFFFSTD